MKQLQYLLAYFLTALSFTGGLYAMEKVTVQDNLTSLPLIKYVHWLNKQPGMTYLLNLPPEEFLETMQDPQARAREAQLNESPNYQSFSKFTSTHKKLLSDQPYLGEILQGNTFLTKLSNLLVRYTDVKVPEVEQAFQVDKQSIKQLQDAVESFLKHYWSNELENKALLKKLKGDAKVKRKDIKKQFNNLYTALEKKTLTPEEAITIFDALISHKALDKFKKYFQEIPVKQSDEVYLQKDDYGNTPLHYLAHKGSLELLEIIPQSAINRLITTKNGSGDTPLHVAIKQGNQEFALYLLALPNVPYEQENNAKQTPLSLATERRQAQVAGNIVWKKAGNMFRW